MEKINNWKISRQIFLVGDGFDGCAIIPGSLTIWFQSNVGHSLILKNKSDNVNKR
jgi:hypothetical protein